MLNKKEINDIFDELLDLKKHEFCLEDGTYIERFRDEQIKRIKK